MFRDLTTMILAGALAAGCGSTDENATSAPAPIAPVVGTVTLREGDCMPVTTPERCRTRPLATRVDAYPVLEMVGHGRRDAVPAGARPTATTLSDEGGRFGFRLPEGRYTILVSDDGVLYPPANSDGEWAPVEVNTGWLEDVTIVVDRATD
ncbi:MAG: hypothetical protein JWP97_3163 [Labilithrix sp.]|nr:hypothetical protein [Labilithrix sp.]